MHEVFNNAVIDFNEMTALPLDLRQLLHQECQIIPFELSKIIEDEETTKFLFWSDADNVFETVLLYHRNHETHELNRMTLCISSQVGCNVWCIFCVTGKMGLKKNLTAAEILWQVLYANNYIKKTMGKKSDWTRRSVRNIVFMWMWEPMLNYPNVKIVCKYLTETTYLWLSRKRVTISTSWVIPPIKQFIQDKLPVSLAFSLHSPDQILREKLVPTIAKYFTLDKLMEVFDEYTKVTGNEVFYEYVMIKDVNDTPELAHTAGKLLRNRKAHLNLIPYNQNPAIDLDESSPERIRQFQKIVMSYDVPVTVRQNMWRKAKSACGQLWYEVIMNASV